MSKIEVAANPVVRKSRSFLSDLLLNDTKGRFCTITYLKKEGEKRTINCQVTSNKLNNLGYILVHSIADKGTRSVDPRTILCVKANGITYIPTGVKKTLTAEA